jgi:hypothetical protein
MHVYRVRGDISNTTTQTIALQLTTLHSDLGTREPLYIGPSH